MKKTSLIVGFCIFSLVFSACNKAAAPAAVAPTPRARIADVNVNQEPVANRPFVKLLPRTDGHAVSLDLITVKKSSTALDYEIEYNSGSLMQGAFGQLTVDPNSLPLVKEILLGSCSTGGKCTYNTDVTGGTLTLRFGNPDFTLKNEWSFADAATSGNSFVSRDGKFTLDTTKANLRSGSVVVFQSPGFPGTLASDPIVGPYAVGLANTLTAAVTVAVRVPSDATMASLMGWDGKTWKMLSNKISSDKLLSYTGALLDAYVVAKN